MQERIRAFIDGNRETIIANLGALVGINTFSRNKAGNDRIQRAIEGHMPPGYTLDVHPQAEVGDNYVYTYHCPGLRPIALHGHVDTLCPEDPTFNRADQRGERIYGPGIHDMRGGLLTLIWSLRTLEHLGLLERMSFIVIFNADEEIGSNSSKGLFLGLAEKDARLAIKFECAALDNTLVTTRKGIARFVLTAHGRAAHFGNLKERKVSAVEEVGEKIRLIESFNRPDGEVAANVGRIGGGLAGNVVAEEAFMEFELRFWDRELMDRTLAEVRRMVLTPSVAGVRLDLEETSNIPPWRPDAESRRLFDLACEVAREMGQTIVEEKRGGISDANWVASAGVPAIDGFGPLGQGDCTRDEFIVLTSLFDRIEMTVRFLLRLHEAEAGSRGTGSLEPGSPAP